MKIYVQSRGIEQDNDYRWLTIQNNNLVPEIPLILKKSEITDLIDNQKYSIILARNKGELLLLVTGMKAREERQDFMGRGVRNSVLWIASDVDESQIRYLTILALQNQETLAKKVDDTIEVGGNYGFKISFNQLENLAKNQDHHLRLGFNENIDLNHKIAKNTPELREEIALELQSNQLPKYDGLLIVITTLKTQETLSKTDVWRGLSNRIQSENWISIKKNKVNNSNLLIFGLILLVIILMILLFLLITQKEEKPQPTPIPEVNPISSPTNLNQTNSEKTTE